MILEIETPHKFTPEDVKSKLLEEASNIQKKYKEVSDINIIWDNYDFKLTFKVMGAKFEGSGKILEDKLISNLKLPGIAKLFSKRIKEGMELKLNQILS